MLFVGTERATPWAQDTSGTQQTESSLVSVSCFATYPRKHKSNAAAQANGGPHV